MSSLRRPGNVPDSMATSELESQPRHWKPRPVHQASFHSGIMVDTSVGGSLLKALMS